MGTIQLVWIYLLFSIVAPGVAVIVVYFAAKGYPKSFDREMWWMCFVVAGAAAALILIVGAKWAPPGVLGRLVMGFCLGTSSLLAGLSMGCSISVFIFKKAEETSISSDTTPGDEESERSIPD